MATEAGSGVPAPVEEIAVESRLRVQGSAAIPGRQSQVVLDATAGVAIAWDVGVDGWCAGDGVAFEPHAAAKINVTSAATATAERR